MKIWLDYSSLFFIVRIFDGNPNINAKGSIFFLPSPRRFIFVLFLFFCGLSTANAQQTTGNIVLRGTVADRSGLVISSYPAKLSYQENLEKGATG